MLGREIISKPVRGCFFVQLTVCPSALSGEGGRAPVGASGESIVYAPTVPPLSCYLRHQ